MTVRAPIATLSEGERTLDDGASHYLTRVLRLAAGARFVAFDPARALEADGEIVSVDTGRAIALFGPTRPARVVAARRIIWIHALAKADKTDAIVRDATELGATRIVVARAERSVVRLDEARATARRERWGKIAREAARQSGRADPPEILGPLSWVDALSQVPDDAACFCLHTAEAPALGPRLRDALAASRPLAFAAGPEGGLTEEELAQARHARFDVTSLGPFVLRTETVAAAVLGAARVFGADDTG
jgi:16S rRNA (uracil1498-N3)-methyltransferase